MTDLDSRLPLEIYHDLYRIDGNIPDYYYYRSLVEKHLELGNDKSKVIEEYTNYIENTSFEILNEEEDTTNYENVNFENLPEIFKRRFAEPFNEELDHYNIQLGSIRENAENLVDFLQMAFELFHNRDDEMGYDSPFEVKNIDTQQGQKRRPNRDATKDSKILATLVSQHILGMENNNIPEYISIDKLSKLLSFWSISMGRRFAGNFESLEREILNKVRPSSYLKKVANRKPIQPEKMNGILKETEEEIFKRAGKVEKAIMKLFQLRETSDKARLKIREFESKGMSSEEIYWNTHPIYFENFPKTADSMQDSSFDTLIPSYDDSEYNRSTGIYRMNHTTVGNFHNLDYKLLPTVGKEFFEICDKYIKPLNFDEKVPALALANYILLITHFPFQASGRLNEDFINYLSDYNVNISCNGYRGDYIYSKVAKKEELDMKFRKQLLDRFLHEVGIPTFEFSTNSELFKIIGAQIFKERDDVNQFYDARSLWQSFLMKETQKFMECIRTGHFEDVQDTLMQDYITFYTHDAVEKTYETIPDEIKYNLDAIYAQLMTSNYRNNPKISVQRKYVELLDRESKLKILQKQAESNTVNELQKYTQKQLKFYEDNAIYTYGEVEDEEVAIIDGLENGRIKDLIGEASKLFLMAEVSKIGAIKAQRLFNLSMEKIADAETIASIDNQRLQKVLSKYRKAIIRYRNKYFARELSLADNLKVNTYRYLSRIFSLN